MYTQTLSLRHNLPFGEIGVTYQGRTLAIPHVIFDTGSASTILQVDAVRAIGISPALEDTIDLVRGVGGYEPVFHRTLDHLRIGTECIADLQVDVGGMDYGFTINGIVGMDVMHYLGVILDLKRLVLMV